MYLVFNFLIMSIDFADAIDQMGSSIVELIIRTL